MTQTFIDTLVVCTLTGLVILTTVLATVDAAGTPEAAALWNSLNGSQWTAIAFRESLPGDYGDIIVSVGLALFAFSTILGWSYYGEKSIQYLVGLRAVVPYRILFAAAVVAGPLIFDRRVWLFSDIANGLMAIPNLVGLVLLAGIVVRETKSYFARSGGQL
jgi:AGCS family alanine or glycine:cation symporter